MYLRRCYRNKDGKRHGYWALVESYRSSRGPRQRVVAYLGEMDAAGRLGIRQQAAGAAAVAQRGLFRDVAPQWVEVDLKRIAIERKRAFGGPADGFAKCQWKRIDRWQEWARLSEGCYVLRSNVTDWSPEELWRAYMQLTEAEAAFRIQKTDLQLRPIWHQKQERVEAHILVCFLAFVLWKTLAQLCQRAGLGNEPRKVFQELADITLVDVVLPTRNGVIIRKRCISRPTVHQAILLQHLNLHLPNSLEMAQV